MNIHFNPAMTWGSLGTRVLTHPQIRGFKFIQYEWGTDFGFPMGWITIDPM
jgi:hypothetical protein